MVTNYFKIAWRSLRKNKTITFINILGLGLGIASCLLILLFVADELSYDQFNTKANQIVRVVFKANISNEEVKEAVVMAPVAKTLKEEFPEVLNATRIRDRGLQNIAAEDKHYRKLQFAYADPTLFEVFTLPILYGNTKTPLKEPNSIVISKATAESYFGEASLAIGELLHLEEREEPFVVTAIMKNIPQNAHFDFDVFCTMVDHAPAQSTSWTDSGFHTYLLLKKNYNPSLLEAKLPGVLEKYMGAELQEALGISYAAFTQKNTLGLFLQPLTTIHLNSDFSAASQIKQGGNKTYIYIFTAISLFMLFIACINFTNLSTAAASKRAKEVGVKKVLGSGKKQLRYQFLIESFLSTLIAMLLGVGLCILLLPFFNSFAGKALELSYLFRFDLLLFLIVLLVIISLLAGMYPAFLLSSFEPLLALKSKFYGKGNSKGIRSTLVVFQFTISTVLIFATLVVKQQMNFIQHKALGYDKNEILVIRNSNTLQNRETVFASDLNNDSRTLNVSIASHVPAGSTNDNMWGIFVNNEFLRRMFVYHIDENYIPTLGMKLVAGRNFSPEYGADTTKIIINQSAAKLLGFENNALGKVIENNTKAGKQSKTIIGVVQDFHFKSLHQRIEPLVLSYNPSGNIIVKAAAAHMPSLIKLYEKKWNDLEATEPFHYTLLDEDYNQTYLSEKKMGNLLSSFALLTILVACLGLFGLITFTAEQRFKEIGIRKVLGSSALDIVKMLSKDFLKLVGISFLLAFPIGHFFMNTWLQDFAYHTNILWWVYVLSAFIILIIASLTISLKSFRAASINPIKSIRTE